MRIRKTKSKNSEHYAIIYDTKDINGKRSTKIYQNIGNYNDLKKLAQDEEPLTWLKNYVNELNQQIQNNSLPILLKKYPNRRIQKNEQLEFNAGYLFLQDIYYKLGLNRICDDITNKYQFK